jgi:hypothetical protein
MRTGAGTQRLATVAVLAALLACLGLAGLAHAQALPETPVHPAIDGNAVDVSSGQFSYTKTTLSRTTSFPQQFNQPDQLILPSGMQITLAYADSGTVSLDPVTSLATSQGTWTYAYTFRSVKPGIDNISQAKVTDPLGA